MAAAISESYRCSSCNFITGDLLQLLSHQCDVTNILPSQDQFTFFPVPNNTQMRVAESRSSTPSSMNSSDSEQSSGVSGTTSGNYGTYDKLVRKEEAHVRLLIACWKMFKPLFKGKKTKKEIFSLISFEFNKNCKEKVTGDQCLRKLGKLVSQHKEVEDHNKITGNDHKDWKFLDDMSECLEKDISVNPSFTMESSAHFSPDITQQTCADNENEDNSHDENVTPQEKTKRCRKRPRSRSSAAEMLDFLKSYSEKREKVEEEKLKIVKKMKEEKKEFFDKFLSYLEKKQ